MHRPGCFDSKGYVLIELIIISLVVAILALTVVSVVVTCVQLFIYTPRYLDAQKIAQELSETIIEGSNDVLGLRYATRITFANATLINYTYGYPSINDGKNVSVAWNSSDSHLYRSNSSFGGGNLSSPVKIPYYIYNTTTITGRVDPEKIFSYTNLTDQNWANANTSDIRRVSIAINVTTGSGVFGANYNSADYNSSVEIKGFN